MKFISLGLQYLLYFGSHFHFPSLMGEHADGVQWKIIHTGYFIFFFIRSCTQHIITIVCNKPRRWNTCTTVGVGRANLIHDLNLLSILCNTGKLRSTEEINLPFRSTTNFFTQQDKRAKTIIIISYPLTAISVITISLHSIYIILLSSSHKVSTLFLVLQQSKCSSCHAGQAHRVPVIRDSKPIKRFCFFQTTVDRAEHLLTESTHRQSFRFGRQAVIQ